MARMSETAAVPCRLDLLDSLERVPGIGPRRLGLLAAAGICRIADLLYRSPLRFEDRSLRATVSTLTFPSPPVRLEGRLRSIRTRQSPVRRLDVTEAVFDDGTGVVPLVWFNQGYLSTRFTTGSLVAIFGQPRMSDGRLRIENSEIAFIDPAASPVEPGITPIYGQLGTLPSATVRRLVEQALGMAMPVEDPLPVPLRRRLGLPDLSRALLETHYPSATGDGIAQGTEAARRRLAFDEFFAYQLLLRGRRRLEGVTPRSPGIRVDDGIRSRLRAMLPFRLTGAQRRVLKEIATDLQSQTPMYRLLQGDVGSGKTIAALLAAALVALNGRQAAFLAPTEILAEQHFRTMKAILDPAGITLALLTASTAASDRARILRELKKGSLSILIGTHAILEPDVRFGQLALAVVDEQHRFGVDQRRRLFEKGNDPDILLMTATPIPRSLALTLYGDLEISTLDELPPGRNPVKTAVRGSAQFARVLDFVRTRMERGGQAYIVYPLIEESDRSEYKHLMQGIEDVRDALPGVSVEALHGRMKPAEKDDAMRRFARGETSVLVCTTVVEVGVDVPAAEVMVIVDAERYGLAQLHQLRGRVGRGGREGWCVLLRDERAREDAKARLREFATTTDGFEVAEKDLRTRGAGDLLGTRQSGAPVFRFGDALRDLDLMFAARDAAAELIETLTPEAAIDYATRLAPTLALASPDTRD